MTRSKGNVMQQQVWTEIVDCLKTKVQAVQSLVLAPS